MKAREVHEFFVGKDVDSLFHANSVKTSLSLMQLGGLASRGLVVRSGLLQTNQITDDLDKELGIWDDVFVDTLDLHLRASNRNVYGPVLFILNVDMLLSLPEDAVVRVTRSNPKYWKSSDPDSKRYFLNKAELEGGWRYGDFGQMVVIRTPGGIVPFGSFLRQIVLDDPVSTTGNPSSEFSNAARALMSAHPLVASLLVKRTCSFGCRCVNDYAAKSTRISYFFTP